MASVPYTLKGFPDIYTPSGALNVHTPPVPVRTGTVTAGQLAQGGVQKPGQGQALAAAPVASPSPVGAPQTVTPPPTPASGSVYDQRLAALKASQDKARNEREGQYQADLNAVNGKYTTGLGVLGTNLNDVAQQMQQLQGVANLVGAEAQPDLQARIQALNSQYIALQSKIQETTQARDAEIAQVQARRAGLDAQTKSEQDLYDRASAAVKDIAGSDEAQQRIYAHNDKALADYNTAKDAYDKAAAAQADYGTQLSAYETARDARDADIAAGKYAVNPYQQVKNGANLQDLMAIRQQLDAGVLRPNLHVPDAPVAPTAPAPLPQLPQNPDIIANVPEAHYDDDVVKALGYTAPKLKSYTYDKINVAPPAPTPTPEQTPPAPASTTPTPTSTDKTPTTSQPSRGSTQQTQPAQGSTQQTSSQASRTTTTQATQPTGAPQQNQPLNPSASLAPQTAGTVAGQTASSNQNKDTAAPATPKAITNPEPFKPEEDKKDENTVWEP